MDMTLSKRGDYVVRSAISLARAFENGEYRKIRQVVQDTEIPQTFAPQILSDLLRAGIAISRSGRDGGYRLTRSPEQISALDVIEAAEGTLRAEHCALGDGPCRWDAICPLHETWTEASTALRDLLGRTTLAELAARDVAIEQGTYSAIDAHRSHPLLTEISDAVQVELRDSDLMDQFALLVRKDKISILAGLAVALSIEKMAGSRSSANAKRRLGGGNKNRDTQVSLATKTRNARPGGRVEKAAIVEAYTMVWVTSEPDPGTTLEAELVISVVDPTRCEITVTGAWRQKPGGNLLDVSSLEAHARQVLRTFLRMLARSLEEPDLAVASLS